MNWKRILLIIGLILVTLVALGTYRFYKIGPVAPAYVAKTLCSGVFVSGRTVESVLEEDLPEGSVFGLIGYEIDRDRRLVTASISGLAPRQAIYRDGLGCTLLSGTPEEVLIAQAEGFSHSQIPVNESLPWPNGDGVNPALLAVGMDQNRLEQALDRAFSEPDSLALRRTRAVLVVQNGRIVAERYAPGITPDMPLIGWSMTKGVTNALVGILVGAGKLHLDEPAPVESWRSPGDPRGDITLAHLLHMSSGLQFDESYDNPQSHVNQMLLLKPDGGAYAASLPLAVDPDEHFAYSSGTTGIIAEIVNRAVGSDPASRFRFPYEALFDRIGVKTAVLEPDASGTFVGSSFMYASARDWARIGLLYLRDGVWNGERILPEGWVSFSTTPAPAAPNGKYGSQLWLNAGDPNALSKRPWPSLPVDTYMMLGYEGQSVTVVPSYDAVIVRLGMTHSAPAWDVESFVSDVLSALPPAADCGSSIEEEDCSI